MFKYVAAACAGAVRAFSTRATKNEIKISSFSNPRLYEALEKIGAAYADAAIFGKNDELMQSFVVQKDNIGTIVSVVQNPYGITTVYSIDSKLINTLKEEMGDMHVIGNCDGQASS